MMRRIIRTLPLYFFIVLSAGIFKLIIDRTSIHFTVNEYWKYLLVIPNFAYEENNFILRNLWAVGVTEQFYLVWGGLIIFFRKLQVVKMLGLLAFAYSLLLTFPDWMSYGNPIVYLPNFVIGALFAHLYNLTHYQTVLNSYLSNILITIISLSIAILLIIFSFSNSFINENYLLRQFCLSTSFSFLILLVSSTPYNKLFTLQPIRYFGKISYSFYCLHSIVLVLLGFVFNRLPFSVDIALKYIIVLSISLFISHLSYQYFEKRILSLKRFFYK